MQTACSNAIAPVEITVDSCGESVRLGLGDILVVRLASQVTTGYLWANEPLAEAVVTLNGEPVIEYESRDVDGGSDVQVFRFQATSLGNTTLNFRYQRPWQKGEPPNRTCSIAVMVED